MSPTSNHDKDVYPDYLRKSRKKAARADLLGDLLVFLAYEKPEVLKIGEVHDDRFGYSMVAGTIRKDAYKVHVQGELAFGSGRISFEVNRTTCLHLYVLPCRTYAISCYTPHPEAEAWLFSLAPLEAIAIAAR
jgi:hypothetical protein